MSTASANNANRWRIFLVGLAALAIVGAGIGVVIAMTRHDSNTQQSPQPAASQDLDPVAYYLSDARRQPLQHVLDTTGVKLANAMLNGAIPWETAAWDKTSPAPRDGYGLLRSKPSTGPVAPDQTFVELVVRFTGGNVDLSRGVLMLEINKGGIDYTLQGSTTLNSLGQPVQNGPDAYQWTVSDFRTPDTANDHDKHMYLSFADLSVGSSLPSWEAPLDPSFRYKLNSVGYHGAPVSVGFIKANDESFIESINNLGVTSLDWFK